MNMSLFYSEPCKLELINYADVDYLLDPPNNKSQTRDLFSFSGTTILWKYM